jgi:hypothetical protein
MFTWLRRLHMYAGLFAFTAFVVWGLTGITAAFLPAPGASESDPVVRTKEVAFRAPDGVDDRALARLVYDAADVAMSVAPRGASRNADGDLAFHLETPNGRRDVTYREAEGRILVQYRGGSLALFVSEMHEGSLRRGPPDWPARIWRVYNEIAAWAFLFMTLTGLYLWLATRPKLRWAWITFVTGSGAVAALWLITG